MNEQSSKHFTQWLKAATVKLQELPVASQQLINSLTSSDMQTIARQ
jgi:hypothetical protein